MFGNGWPHRQRVTYVTYDEETDQFSLTEEQAFALANEDSPAYLPGTFQLALGSIGCGA